jgi:hypothetical protein
MFDPRPQRWLDENYQNLRMEARAIKPLAGQQAALANIGQKCHKAPENSCPFSVCGTFQTMKA